MPSDLPEAVHFPLNSLAISGCPESGASLYPTQVVAAFGSTVARTTAFAYDCASGRVTTRTDVDNSLTRTFGYDSLARPTSLDEAGLRQQRTSYQDDQRTEFVERDQLARGDYKLAAAVKYDALGRVARERSNTTTKISKTGSGGIRVDRGYRYSGANRYELVSTPYLSSGAGWTRTKYDRNGRVVEVKVFAGQPAPWGNNTTSLGATTTSYSANTTTVTDPAGVARTHTYDGLGRLTRVRENGISATTCYGYDVLDNLTQVRQGATVSGSSCSGGQLRTFSYDSLSRLKTAVNPESGTTTYSYDDNGNLSTKTDARGGTVTHAYDNLDRITGTSYSGGGTDFSSTPAVTYAYSAGASSSCKNKHRLTSVSSSVSTTSYSCYDELGRVTTSSQQTGGTTYSFSYLYNPDDTLQSVTYPSTRKVAYQYDTAGRLTAVGENTVGATDYASAISYKPHGGINSLTLGNGLHESWAYNQRLQPTAIKLGTTSGGSDKLKLEFTYKTPNKNDNNGNVLKQIITRPSLTALTQSYTYDGANRLKTAAESGAGTAWSRTYGYDVYGNRAVTANSGLPTSPLMPTATTNYSASTNRLTLTGARYDNAGNLTATSLGDTLKYDAENRLKSYTYRNATTNYKYGPEGRRVQKATPTVTETYVYDAFGKLAAEYSTTAPTSGGTFYRTTDHLGSTRLVTKQDKSDADCYDYAPFGEEIPNTLGSRSSNACFAASFDGRHRFTGKERDDESDLDYFGARYYSGPLGRFLSPDAPFADQYPGNPQSWNLYGYVRNSPLSFVDPTGAITVCVTEDDPNCTPSDDPEGIRFVTTTTAKNPEGPADPIQSSFRKVLISAITRAVGRAAPLANALFFLSTAVAGAPSGGAGTLTGVAASKAGNFLKLPAKLLRAANKLDPADKGGLLTKAGRALQKHGGRQGSKFPPARGSPQQINAQALEIVRDILNNPARQVQKVSRPKYGEVIEVYAPSGQGIRYSADGKTLIGFLN